MAQGIGRTSTGTSRIRMRPGLFVAPLVDRTITIYRDAAGVKRQARGNQVAAASVLRRHEPPTLGAPTAHHPHLLPRRDGTGPDRCGPCTIRGTEHRPRIDARHPAHAGGRRVRTADREPARGPDLHTVRGRHRHLPADVGRCELRDPAGTRQAQLSEAQVDALLAFAVGPGGLGEAAERYDQMYVSDAPTTTFTIDTPELTKTVSAYALGFELPAGDPNAEISGPARSPRGHLR